MEAKLKQLAKLCGARVTLKCTNDYVEIDCHGPYADVFRVGVDMNAELDLALVQARDGLATYKASKLNEFVSVVSRILEAENA